MRIPFRPRPTRDELMASPLHVIVRDFPETLAEFRAHGLSLEEFGHQTLGDLDEFGDILEDLEASTAWRPRSASA